MAMEEVNVTVNKAQVVSSRIMEDEISQEEQLSFKDTKEEVLKRLTRNVVD